MGLLLLSAVAVLVADAADETDIDTDDRYDYLTCDDFLHHTATINRAVGVRDPRSVPGYSRLACRRVFDLAKKSNIIDHVVNLGTFIQEQRDAAGVSGGSNDGNFRLNLTEDAEVWDQAEYERRRYRRRHRRNLQGEVFDACDVPIAQSNPGLGSDARAILPCSDANRGLPCIPDFLNVDNSTISPAPYQQTIPTYPDGGSYRAWVASIQDTFDLEGCNRNRPSAGSVGGLLIGLTTANFIRLAAQIAATPIPDSINIPIIAKVIEVPSPVKIVVQIIVSIAQLIELGLATAFEQTQSQLRWVASAETRGVYGNTRNLLDKQCAVFDQAVCRPVKQLGIGSGCDGIDSNCNKLVDECDEDIIAPTMDISAAVQHCSSTESEIWFPSRNDAEQCVQKTLDVIDDCQEIQSTDISSDGNCANAEVNVTATDGCGNTSPIASIPVQIDGTAPEVSCSFGAGIVLNSTEIVLSIVEPGRGRTGNRRLQNVDFSYDVQDNCAGGMISTKVDIYSSEIDTTVDKMGMFIERKSSPAQLFLQVDSCKFDDDTDSPQTCILDPAIEIDLPNDEVDEDLPDVRLYIAEVTAVDEAGNVGTATCSLFVCEDSTRSSSDTDFYECDEIADDVVSSSRQRYLVSSHTSKDKSKEKKTCDEACRRRRRRRRRKKNAARNEEGEDSGRRMLIRRQLN